MTKKVRNTILALSVIGIGYLAYRRLSKKASAAPAMLSITEKQCKNWIQPACIKAPCPKVCAD